MAPMVPSHGYNRSTLSWGHGSLEGMWPWHPWCCHTAAAVLQKCPVLGKKLFEGHVAMAAVMLSHSYSSATGTPHPWVLGGHMHPSTMVLVTQQCCRDTLSQGHRSLDDSWPWHL